MKRVSIKITTYLILLSILCPRSWASEMRDCWDFDVPGGTCGNDLVNGGSSSGGGEGYEAPFGIDLGADGTTSRLETSGGQFTQEEYERRTAYSLGKYSHKFLDPGFGLIQKEWPNHSYNTKYNAEIWNRNDHDQRSIKPSSDVEVKKYRELLGTRRIVTGWAHPSEVTNQLQLHYHWVTSSRADAKSKDYWDGVEERRRKSKEEVEERVQEKNRIYFEREMQRLNAAKEAAVERERIATENKRLDDERSRQESIRLAEIRRVKEEEAERIRLINDASSKEKIRAGQAEWQRKYDSDSVRIKVLQETITPKSVAVAAMCFAGETLVNMSATEFKSIDTLRIGDVVETCDLDSEIPTCEQRPITHLIHNQATHLYDLSVADKVIRVTDNHPFYVANFEANGWVEAKDLKIGDLLQSITGEAIQLDNIREEFGDFDVYNIETESNHNYYVSGLLVHNCTVGAVATAITELPALGVIAGLYLGNSMYNRVQDFLGRNFAKSEAVETENAGGSAGEGSSIEDYLKTTVQQPNRGSPVDHRTKGGGFDKAIEDFDKLAIPSSVKPMPGMIDGKIGVTKGGDSLGVRPSSTGGFPTLQIDRPNGAKIKVRY